MLLSITALGYASVWIDGWLRLEGRAEKIGELIGLPKGKIVRIILPIGIPEDEYRQPQKKPFKERAWFNKYGSESN
jgi:nitroreductase